MKLTITQKVDEPLLKRVRVEGNMVFDAETPSTATVTAEIGKQVSGDEKTISIVKIDTAYGERTASVVAYVYESEEARKALLREEKKEEAPKQS